jgi:hypothetical protein
MQYEVEAYYIINCFEYTDGTEGNEFVAGPMSFWAAQEKYEKLKREYATDLKIADLKIVCNTIAMTLYDI